MYALPQVSFRDATNICFEHDILGLLWVEDKCFRTLFHDITTDSLSDFFFVLVTASYILLLFTMVVQ